jgi:hypothetical protein
MPIVDRGHLCRSWLLREMRKDRVLSGAVGSRRCVNVCVLAASPQGHPMKPHRIRVAHHLIVVRARASRGHAAAAPVAAVRLWLAHSGAVVGWLLGWSQAYDLYRKMEVLRPTPSTAQEMTKFHSNDYVAFMQNVRAHRCLPPVASSPTSPLGCSANRLRCCRFLRRSPRTTTRMPSLGRS